MTRRLGLYMGHPLGCSAIGCARPATWTAPTRIAYGRCDEHRTPRETVPLLNTTDFSAWPEGPQAWAHRMTREERETARQKAMRGAA